MIESGTDAVLEKLLQSIDRPGEWGMVTAHPKPSKLG